MLMYIHVYNYITFNQYLVNNNIFEVYFLLNPLKIGGFNF